MDKLMEHFKTFIEDQITKQLGDYFTGQLLHSYRHENSWALQIHKMVTEKFVNRFIDENYAEIVTKLDTDKILKLIEANSAIKILAYQTKD